MPRGREISQGCVNAVFAGGAAIGVVNLPALLLCILALMRATAPVPRERTPCAHRAPAVALALLAMAAYGMGYVLADYYRQRVQQEVQGSGDGGVHSDPRVALYAVFSATVTAYAQLVAMLTSGVYVMTRILVDWCESDVSHLLTSSAARASPPDGVHPSTPQPQSQAEMVDVPLGELVVETTSVRDVSAERPQVDDIVVPSAQSPLYTDLAGPLPPEVRALRSAYFSFGYSMGVSESRRSAAADQVFEVDRPSERPQLTTQTRPHSPRASSQEPTETQERWRRRLEQSSRSAAPNDHAASAPYGV